VHKPRWRSAPHASLATIAAPITSQSSVPFDAWGKTIVKLPPPPPGEGNRVWEVTEAVIDNSLQAAIESIREGLVFVELGERLPDVVLGVRDGKVEHDEGDSDADFDVSRKNSSYRSLHPCCS